MLKLVMLTLSLLGLISHIAPANATTTCPAEPRLELNIQGMTQKQGHAAIKKFIDDANNKLDAWWDCEIAYIEENKAKRGSDWLGQETIYSQRELEKRQNNIAKLAEIGEKYLMTDRLVGYNKEYDATKHLLDTLPAQSPSLPIVHKAVPMDEVQPSPDPCPQSIVLAYMKGRADIAWRHAYLADIDDAYRPLLAKPKSPETDLGLLSSYRRCIDRAIVAINQDEDRIIDNMEQSGTQTYGDPWLSDLALQLPRLYVLKAMTYLVPTSIGQQQPQLAAQSFRDSAEAYLDVQSDYQNTATDYYAAQGNLAASEAARRQRIADMSTFAATIIAGSVLKRDPTAIVQKAQERRENAMQALSEDNEARQSAEAALFDELTVTWSDDGVRMTIPRYVVKNSVDPRNPGRNVFYAAFGAANNREHFDALVRVKNSIGHCTGVLVGPKLVLTNRHCVMDIDTGIRFDPVTFVIRLEELQVERHLGGRMQFSSKPVFVSGVQAVHTPDLTGGSTQRRIDDWAFLELTTASQWWVGMADPANLPTENFPVAIAGYSVDLNDGSYITLDWGCTAQASKDGLITHSCKTWNGASGSPIIAVDNAQRDMVIGVHNSKGSGTFLGRPTKHGTASPEMYATYLALRKNN